MDKIILGDIMWRDFGEKVKNLRIAKKLTREDICGDEKELSIRQLARIESGQSIPSLAKVMVIAKALEVSVGLLTDSKDFELPRRYKELKYSLLRTPTYTDEFRLSQRDNQLSEIFIDHYESLPEVEQIIVDCLQTSMDVTLSDNTNYGCEIINEYLEQLKIKERYLANDLILIDLYLVCCRTSKFSKEWYDEKLYNSLLDKVLGQIDLLDVEDLFLLNQLLVTFFSISIQLENKIQVKKIVKASKKVTTKIQDFQRMPILNLMEWKYNLYFKKDQLTAEVCYNKALQFALLMGNHHLEENIRREWENDIK
ncbi:helix-turn-helix domain-containing protein [Streptococcus catagoni]|uniref:helix-turn-helix domain-containing protein n=1 Tax=Streptococcus catagoni TaxID=2654874 RepID=UPI001F3DDE53|nr:XRE family transcriptional regulator [Streptococcus catagoni]